MAALIEFDGLGENLVKGLVEARDATVKLREETVKEGEALKQLGAEGSKATQNLATTIEGTTAALQEVRKEAAKGGATTAIDKTTTATKGLTSAQKDLAKQAQASGSAIEQAQSKGSSAIAESRQRAAEAIRDMKTLTQAEKEAAAAAGGISKEFAALGKSSGGANLPDNMERAAVATKSLRAQLREAKAELDQITEASDGKITPEFIAAAQKVGQLEDRFADLNATAQAFNPDTKFKAVLGVVGNLTGGIQAASSAMGLFGSESEDVNKALLKVQQASAFFQGLQSFVGGLADNYKNLKAVIAASTLATQADTTAKGANAAGTVAVAGANTAAAGATGVFTTALNTMKAALLSNPITAIAVAVLALATAFVSATSDNKDYNAELNKTIDGLDRLTKINTDALDQKLRLKGIENERQALEANESDAAKRRRIEQDYIDKRGALIGKQLEYELNLRTLIAEVESLRGKDSDAAIEARQTAIKKLEEYASEFKAVSNDIVALEGEKKNELLKIGNEERSDRAATAKQRLDLETQLADDILSAEKSLADKVAALDEETADPGRRLELQRNAALEEVRILEQTLLKKKALAELEVRLNAETFSKLTDAQKDAQAQALIDDGTIQLSVKQQEQVASAQFAVWDKYWDERLALDREQRAALLDLQADGFEKERAAFDIELEGRVQKLRESGATEIALAQFIQEQRDQFRSGQVQKAIDQEEELALARINAQVQGAESEFAFRQRVELEKLAAQESFAQQRLQAIKDDTSEEAELTKLQLEAVINGIKEKREELANQQAPFDLFDLLGIKVTDSQKQQILSDLKSIGQNILSFASANIAAQQATVDAQIAASDQIIEDQQRRRDELTALLQQEQEDNDAGLANNLDGIKAEIAATKEAEAEALAARKAGLAEKRALAKQQAIIDSATQVSNLITAGSALLKDGALKGIPGTIAAIAFIVSLAATFAGIKAKIKAANNSVPQFKKGGMLPGPSHEQGGVAMVDRRGNQIAEAEGGEYMVNKKSTVKYKHILEGINADTIPDSHHKAIRQIMDMEGIGMSTEVVRHIVTNKEKVIERRDSGNSEALAKLTKRVDGLLDELQGFREQERTRPRGDAKTTVTPTKTVTRRG